MRCLMDKLDALHEVLTNLKDVSNNIINSSVELFNTILIDTDDLYDKFRQRTQSDLTDNQIDEHFNSSIGAYISDAKSVKREIDQFIRNIIGNKAHDEETFLYQVWSGDVYDAREVDALLQLYEELVEQEEKFTLDVVFEKAVEHFNERTRLTKKVSFAC